SGFRRLRMTRSVALVTWSGLTALTADDRLLAIELARRGIAVRAVVWDDPRFDWRAFDLVVLRSTWDYHLRPDEFARWIARMEAEGAPLRNRPQVIARNMHKGYLLELRDRGVPIVPTELIARGASVALPELFARNDWSRVVVKPAISATAFETIVVPAAEAHAAQRDLDRLLGVSDVLVQPFVEELANCGEWSFVFFAGAYSHAVLKRPRPGDFRVQNDFGGTAEALTPDETLIDQARAVVAANDAAALYARVDGVEIDGIFHLMELELIEPALFLGWDVNAPRRFADVIVEAMRFGES
ncbi:MAG TPA: hypothetical protein VEZ11_04290, partial [Thermoanaerobaculia bacterium]|nr:hypothetical protein [Thermoanaerobaculia bacterium]